MEGIENNAAAGAGGTAAAGGASGGGSSAGDLQAAFDKAIGEARQTLQISTVGNAQLNTLRARPQ